MKKIKIIGVFIIMGLSFVSHFMYEWFNNFIFSILFPVNESIWEHMKLLFTPVLFFSVFEYTLYRIKGINVNNFLLSLGCSTIVGIASYLIIYLPIDYFFGHSMVVSIILLFIDYCFMSFISYIFISGDEIKYSCVFGSSLILIILFMFYYLTYYPVHSYIFYDVKNNYYGIKKEA